MTEGTRWQFVVFICLLVALHFFLRYGVALGIWAPDLLVVALLLVSRRVRPGTAAGIGVLLGLLEGSANPVLFGVPSLALAILGYLGSRSRELLAGDDPLNLVAFLFVGTVAYQFLLFLVLAMQGRGVSPVALLIPALLGGIYAAAAGLGAVSLYRTVA
jgi:rod shape-determining protein MreD